MELMISDFLCKTCRVRPKPNTHKFAALFYSINAGLDNDRTNDLDCNWTVTSSGSASEFFIEPMLSCISDYDVMYNSNNILAIPKGHSVPRCLPAEFHHRVEVCQFIETEFPGYVTVELIYELIKCNNDDYYECFPSESRYATITKSLDDILRHGPAVIIPHGPAQQLLNASPAKRKYKFSDRDSSKLSVDRVYCIPCLVWPPQAADWSTRRRKNGWPDSTSIECIAKNGCDVVQISHPLSRQDDWIREHQWRLSFSRAETVLLNSWSVKQQIIYHLFRIFIKTVRLEAGTSEVVHNYIIKTIMLWTCELWSPMTWNSRNLVCISRLLIHKLATCLESFKCQSFFVTHLNILNYLESTENLNYFASKLMNITDESLCVWLIDNYIRQCAEQSPFHTSRLFHDNRNVPMLPYKLLCITEWHRSRSDEFSYIDFEAVCCELQRLVYLFLSLSNSEKSLPIYISEHLHAIDSRLMPYYYAACLLEVSSWLDCGQSLSQVADVLIMLIQSGACVFANDDSKLVEQMNVRQKIHVPVVSSGTHSFTVCKHFRTASALMLTTRLLYNKVSSLSRLLTELSKVYLHSALQCSDVECEEFHLTSRCQLNVLLSCLDWSTAQRKSALIHSRNAISIPSVQKHRTVFCHVERQFLPCFDETLETVLGLVIFYRFLKRIFSNHIQRNRQFDVLTADLFAFYLINLQSDVYCSNMFCKSRRSMYNKYRTRLLRKTELTIADFLLFHEVYRKNNFSEETESNYVCDKCKIHVLRGQSVKFNATRLKKLLVQSAVEHLTAFRMSMSRDFSSVRNILKNDFEAIYAYKCHFYEECYRLCEENVDCLLHDDEPATVFVVKECELLRLLDDKCLSLISLAKLCGIFDIDPTLAEKVHQLTMSTYLLVLCKLKLLHSTVTIIEALRKVMIVHKMHDPELIVNRAMMIFVYHKAIRHLRLMRVQHGVA